MPSWWGVQDSLWRTDSLVDDGTVTPGVTYYYWVKAGNEAGTSDFSASDFGVMAPRIVPSDYNGDGASDLALYNQAGGEWYIRTFSGTILVWSEAWGGPGLEPVSGDYDGDGKADLAVYHEASGYWYILKSSDNTLAYMKFGEPGYTPISGDFDVDGIADIAVYHEETGYWYFLLSNSGYAMTYQQFGGPGYAPVK